MTDAERAAAWEQHEREQRRAWRKLSYRQRLDWLWQAKLFAAKALAAARSRRQSS